MNTTHQQKSRAPPKERGWKPGATARVRTWGRVQAQRRAPACWADYWRYPEANGLPQLRQAWPPGAYTQMDQDQHTQPHQPLEAWPKA